MYWRDTRRGYGGFGGYGGCENGLKFIISVGYGEKFTIFVVEIVKITFWP